MIRSAFALFGLAVGCAGTGVFIATGICIWSVKIQVNQQSATLATRANKALDAADRAIVFVRDVIGKAEADLTVARLDSLGQTRPQTPINPLIQLTARKASQDLVGSVERAHGAIVTASEAVVVADAALDVVGGVPELKQLFGVGPEQVEATRSALGNVSSELQQARGVLGFPITAPDGIPTTEQLHAVDHALRQGRGFTDEIGKVVETAHARVNDTRAAVDLWALRVAVGTTILSTLATIGQLFMVRYFWRALHCPRGMPGPP